MMRKIPGVSKSTRGLMRVAILAMTIACIGLGSYLVDGSDSMAARRMSEEATEKPTVQAFVLNSFGLFYMFIALYIVCDEFFVPALDVISNKLGLSPDVAGATFMAAGGSAPEFFTAMVGTLGGGESGDVGVAAIVGSAVFNVLFVIGMCGVAAPGTLRLTWYPLARDSTFYTIDLLTLIWAFWDAKVEWHEAAVLFALYVAYCIYMSQSAKIEKKITYMSLDEGDREAKRRFDQLDANQDGVLSRAEVSRDAGLAARFDELDRNRDGKLDFDEMKWELRSMRNWVEGKTGVQEALLPNEEEEPNEPMTLKPPTDASFRDLLWYVISFPLVFALVLTVPDVRRTGCFKKLYVPAFFLAICWIAVFSKFMVDFSDVVGKFTGIPTDILGLTLLAWGTSVPDLLTSILVTVQGHGDMAVSSSIGSNIFDVTVGLPVPWLVYSAINAGKAKEVNADGLGSSIGMLVVLVVFTIGSIMLNGWHLNKALGAMMLVLWLGFTTFSIYSYLVSAAAE